MENDEKLTSMIEELNEIQSQLEDCERVLKLEMPVVPSDRVERKTVRRTVERQPVETDVKLHASIKELSEQMEDIKHRLRQLEEITVKLELLDEVDEDVNYIKNFMNHKLDKDFEAMYRNLMDQMNIEAIKIYRNIQAVIVEEQAKQNHVLFGVDGKSDKLKFRMNHVMIFSIVSFVVSILVMILQILPAFGVDIF